jgi:hypothetical protein
VKNSLKDIRYRLTIKEILDVNLPFIGSFKELTVRLSNLRMRGNATIIEKPPCL